MFKKISLKISILIYFNIILLLNKFSRLSNQLTVKSLNTSINPIILEKNKLLAFLSKCIEKNITKVKYIFLSPGLRFGNKIKHLENVIFYCHILKCKKILLDKKNFWFIRKNLKIKKYKMSIEIKNEKDIMSDNSIIIDKTNNFFYYNNKYTKYEYNIDIFKNEIYSKSSKINN